MDEDIEKEMDFDTLERICDATEGIWDQDIPDWP